MQQRAHNAIKGAADCAVHRNQQVQQPQRNNQQASGQNSQHSPSIALPHLCQRNTNSSNQAEPPTTTWESMCGSCHMPLLDKTGAAVRAGGAWQFKLHGHPCTHTHTYQHVPAPPLRACHEPHIGLEKHNWVAGFRIRHLPAGSCIALHPQKQSHRFAATMCLLIHQTAHQ